MEDHEQGLSSAPLRKAGDEADSLDEQRMRATGTKTEDRDGNHTLSLV